MGQGSLSTGVLAGRWVTTYITITGSNKGAKNAE